MPKAKYFHNVLYQMRMEKEMGWINNQLGALAPEKKNCIAHAVRPLG